MSQKPATDDNTLDAPVNTNKKYVATFDDHEGPDIMAGPFTDDSEFNNAYTAAISELLESADREVDKLRTLHEWFVSEDYNDGTKYWTNPFLKVTLYIENGRDGWNAGLFDDYEIVPPTIPKASLTDVSKEQAYAYAQGMADNLEKYIDVDLRTGECYYIEEGRWRSYTGPFPTKEKAQRVLAAIHEDPDRYGVRAHHKLEEFTVEKRAAVSLD